MTENLNTVRVQDAQFIVEDLHEQVRELKEEDEGANQDRIEELMRLARGMADGTANVES